MGTSTPTNEYRPGIQAMLQRHEQMGAWLFFCIMSFCVMTFSPAYMPSGGMGEAGPLVISEWWLGSLAEINFGCGTIMLLVHSLCIGFWLLYCLKTASLFVRRSTAWAITGLMFIYSTDFWCAPAELPLVLQTVSLYHILVWARGKKDRFHPRHFLLAGLGLATAGLCTFTQALFWLPIIPLMLWVNRENQAKCFLFLVAGMALPVLATQPLLYLHPEMVHMSIPQLFGGLQGSIIATEPLRIFTGIMPSWAQPWMPGLVALVPGHILLFMWMRPFRKIHPNRKVAINSVLGVAFMLGMWAYFCTTPEQTPPSAPALPAAIMQPQVFTYFLPFVLISLIGCDLVARKWIRNRSAKRVLRGVGLMAPFVSLVVILLIPVLHKAFESPAAPTPPHTAPANTDMKEGAPAAAEGTPI
ncbi:MAG: hypothetical protein IKT79_01710 [Akkermansia sp.]|nr:hypothetical protein [Akkermansia sp.]